MKRRVLRIHSNKKALRTLAAAHQLREPYTVLCDETFLRAATDRSSGGCGTEGELMEHIRDAIGPCTLTVLPETLTALERHMHHVALQFASSHCHAATTSSVAAAAPAAKEAGDEKKATQSNSGTLQQQHATPTPAPPARNELKAISLYVSEGHTVMVATQSHDLRRLLPANCGVVRVSFRPFAVWVELNHANGNNKEAAHSKSTSNIRAGSAPNIATLSPADRAYMKALGVAPANETKKKTKSDRLAQRKRNREPESSTVPVSSASEKDNQNAPAAAAPAAVATRPGNGRPLSSKARHNKPKQPNPLSVKPKTKRETFSVSAAPATKKARTEAAGAR